MAKTNMTDHIMHYVQQSFVAGVIVFSLLILVVTFLYPSFTVTSGPTFLILSIIMLDIVLGILSVYKNWRIGAGLMSNVFYEEAVAFFAAIILVALIPALTGLNILSGIPVLYPFFIGFVAFISLLIVETVGYLAIEFTGFGTKAQ